MSQIRKNLLQCKPSLNFSTLRNIIRKKLEKGRQRGCLYLLDLTNRLTFIILKEDYYE